MRNKKLSTNEVLLGAVLHNRLIFFQDKHKAKTWYTDLSSLATIAHAVLWQLGEGKNNRSTKHK